MIQNCAINRVQMAMWYVSILQAIWTSLPLLLRYMPIMVSIYSSTNTCNKEVDVRISNRRDHGTEVDTEKGKVKQKQGERKLKGKLQPTATQCVSWCVKVVCVCVTERTGISLSLTLVTSSSSTRKPPSGP